MDEASPTQPPKRPCPICGKPAVARHTPFCSQRCATIDLARWITGDYRVPVDETPEEERRPGEDEDPN